RQRLRPYLSCSARVRLRSFPASGRIDPENAYASADAGCSGRIIMHEPRLVLTAVAVIFSAAFAPSPWAQADFYAGKRLVVLVNYAAGGPADIEGRFFARYLARHLAGQPTVIVQNMDGAGGMVGAAYLGEVAPRDGSMLGLLTASAWQFATESAPR